MTTAANDEFVAPEVLSSLMALSSPVSGGASTTTTMGHLAVLGANDSVATTPVSPSPISSSIGGRKLSNPNIGGGASVTTSNGTASGGAASSAFTFAGDVWSYGIVLCHMYAGMSPYVDTLEAMENGVLDPSVPLRQLIVSKKTRPINPVKSSSSPDGPGAIAALGNSSISKLDFSSGDESEELLRGLISQCLQENPNRRCTVQQILSHPFFWM